MTVGIKLGRQAVVNNNFAKYNSELERGISSASEDIQTVSYTTDSSTPESFICLDDYLRNDVETPSAITYDLSSRTTNPFQVRRRAKKGQTNDARPNFGDSPHTVSSVRNVNYNNVTPPQNIFPTQPMINSPEQIGVNDYSEHLRGFVRTHHAANGDSVLQANEAVFVEMSLSGKAPDQSNINCTGRYSEMKLTSFAEPDSLFNCPEMTSLVGTPDSIEYNLAAQITRHNSKVKFSPLETVLPAHSNSERCSEQPPAREVNYKSTRSIVSRLYQTIFGVLSELVTTERSYCNSLYVFSEVVAKTICTKTNVPLKDLRTLFPRSLPDIYCLHVEMLEQMERGLDGIQENVDDILTHAQHPLPHEVLIQFLRLHGDGMSSGLVCSLYTQYLDEFTCAMKTMQRLLRQSFRFRHTVKKLRDHPECEGFDFAAFLLNPVQRLPRYLLLVKQLSKQFEKLIELDLANSMINKALSISRNAESMLHEILVELDARLASYLHYPKFGGLSNGTEILRDSVDKSIGLKRNRSLLTASAKSTNGDKRSGKSGLWPRLRRAFSEKRVDNDKTVVELPDADSSSKMTSDRGDNASSVESFATVIGNADHFDDSDESEAITAACVEPDLAGIGSLCISDHTLEHTDVEEDDNHAPFVSPLPALQQAPGLVSTNTQTTPGLSWSNCSPMAENDIIMGSVAMRNSKVKSQTHKEIQVDSFGSSQISSESENKTKTANEAQVPHDSKIEHESTLLKQNPVPEKSKTPECVSLQGTPTGNERLDHGCSFSNLNPDSYTESRTTSLTSSFTPTYSASLPRQPTQSRPTDKRVKSHTILTHHEVSKKFSLKNFFRRNTDNKNSHPDDETGIRKQRSMKASSFPEEVSEMNQRTSCFHMKLRRSQSSEFRHFDSQERQTGKRPMNDLHTDYPEIENDEVYLDETGNVCFSV